MNALRVVAGFLQRWLLPARPAGLYDRQLVVLALALMSVGLVIVASASIPEGIALGDDPFMFVKRHGMFLVMALGISWFVLQVPMARWQQYNGPMLLLAIVMLVLVLLVGRSVNGSVRWLPLGPFNLQPAEFGKLALFVYLAGYLVRRQSEVRERFIGFMKPMAVLFVVVFASISTHPPAVTWNCSPARTVTGTCTQLLASHRRWCTTMLPSVTVMRAARGRYSHACWPACNCRQNRGGGGAACAIKDSLWIGLQRRLGRLQRTATAPRHLLRSSSKIQALLWFF